MQQFGLPFHNKLIMTQNNKFSKFQDHADLKSET